MTYFWEFEDRCWVISHLEVVSSQFVTELVRAFEEIFRNYPQEKEEYRYQSSKMRRSFGQQHRYIPVLHCDGHTYEVMPGNGLLRKVPIETLPQFGAYKIAEEMPFPDEIDAPVGETDS